MRDNARSYTLYVLAGSTCMCKQLQSAYTRMCVCVCERIYMFLEN